MDCRRSSRAPAAQGPRVLHLAMQGIGDELPHIVEPEGLQLYLIDPCTGLVDRLEHAYQRVMRAHLVLPVGPYQQHMLHLRVRDQVLDQVERLGIQPLQIIKKQRERVLLMREYAKETPEYILEAVFCIVWRQLWNRRLLSNDDLQLGTMSTTS